MKDFWQGFLFAVWLTYIVVKDVGIPLVGKFTGSKQKAEHTDTPGDCPLIQPVAQRVAALEIDLARQQTRVVEFGELLKEHQQSNARSFDMMDNKLDCVLTELKEFRESIEQRVGSLGERMASAETHLEHLLTDKRPRRGGD